MVYLLKMVIFHGKPLNNQMVSPGTSGCVPASAEPGAKDAGAKDSASSAKDYLEQHLGVKQTWRQMGLNHPARGLKHQQWDLN